MISRAKKCPQSDEGQFCLRKATVIYSLVGDCGNFWEFLGIFGSFWEFLGVFGSFWEFLGVLWETVGVLWEQSAYKEFADCTQRSDEA